MIAFDDFLKVDMRVGKVVAVEDFPRAHQPAYKVQVDFGPEIGIKWTSAQAKRDYKPEELLGRQVIGVVNLPPKNIGGFMSEFLMVGVPAEDDGLSLLMPGRPAKIGGRVY